MKPIKMYCVKISYIFDKKLVFSIICTQCGDNKDRIFEEERTEKLKIPGLIEYRFQIHLINMSNEKIGQ